MVGGIRVIGVYRSPGPSGEVDRYLTRDGAGNFWVVVPGSRTVVGPIGDISDLVEFEIVDGDEHDNGFPDITGFRFIAQRGHQRKVTGATGGRGR